MGSSPEKMSPIYPVDEDCDGWRLPSGSLRHGDYDVVDPDLADFDRLPVPNYELPRSFSTEGFPAAIESR